MPGLFSASSEQKDEQVPGFTTGEETGPEAEQDRTAAGLDAEYVCLAN